MSICIGLSGSSGFIGSSFQSYLQCRGIPCFPLLRHSLPTPTPRAIGPLNGTPIPPTALEGCAVVIHAAARAHILRETDPNPLATFRLANTASTLRLAEAAISAGVRRFVFISSIGVLGNHSSGQPLRPTDQVNPVEDYARSKSEAEDGLHALREHSGMELVIIRPTLVHGPGAKGNLQRLMAAIHAGKRLPLGGACNRRSFVGVDNLADALLMAATAELPGDGPGTDKAEDQALLDGSNPQGGQIQGKPIAPRPTKVGRPCRLKPALRSPQARTYHIADDGVISTRRLVEVLAEGMGVRPRLIHVPRWLAVGGATLLGKGAMARRLFDDLEVDDSDFRRDFGWKPMIGLEDGLRKMAADYARLVRDGMTLEIVA